MSDGKPAGFDFRTVSLAELAHDVQRGQVSARELVQHALDRIDAVNEGLNAFVAVDADRALADADDLDRRRARGEDVGPLAGIPIGVKDLEDASGFVTTRGSAAWASRPAATVDSPQVARLRAAGCIILGKTNAPEFGMRAETDNRTFGITCNPWNPARTPGGSSGGSAAAVASGMVPLATGSDGGGSIRIPSAATGLTGLKPSFGRVPVGGVEPPGWPGLSCRGPIARRAADVALALDVVAGPHPLDFTSLPTSPGSFADALALGVMPKRVAWSPTLGYADVDRGVLDVCEAAVRRLAASGCEVIQLDHVFNGDPSVEAGALIQTFTWRTIEPLRGTEWWEQLDPILVLAVELARLSGFSALDVVAGLDAAHRRAVELSRALDGVDLLLCPVARARTAVCENVTTVASLLDVMPQSATDSVLARGPEVMDELLGLASRLEPLNVPVGTIDGVPTPLWHGMTAAFNLIGVPAGTVCAGLDPDGMPVGLQVIGRPHSDGDVLAALAHLEQLLGSPLLPVSL